MLKNSKIEHPASKTRQFLAAVEQQRIEQETRRRQQLWAQLQQLENNNNIANNNNNNNNIHNNNNNVNQIAPSNFHHRPPTISNNNINDERSSSTAVMNDGANQVKTESFERNDSFATHNDTQSSTQRHSPSTHNTSNVSTTDVDNRPPQSTSSPPDVLLTPILNDEQRKVTIAEALNHAKITHYKRFNGDVRELQMNVERARLHEFSLPFDGHRDEEFDQLPPTVPVFPLRAPKYISICLLLL